MTLRLPFYYSVFLTTDLHKLYVYLRGKHIWSSENIEISDTMYTGVKEKLEPNLRRKVMLQEYRSEACSSALPNSRLIYAIKKIYELSLQQPAALTIVHC